MSYVCEELAPGTLSSSGVCLHQLQAPEAQQGGIISFTAHLEWLHVTLQS